MSPFAYKPPDSPETPDCRRTSPRVCPDDLRSSLGTVLDISRGGLRALCRRVPPKKLQVVLGQGKEARVLEARLAWSVRCGFRKYIVGVEFEVPQDGLTEQFWGVGIQSQTVRVI